MKILENCLPLTKIQAACILDAIEIALDANDYVSVSDVKSMLMIDQTEESIKNDENRGWVDINAFRIVRSERGWFIECTQEPIDDLRNYFLEKYKPTLPLPNLSFFILANGNHNLYYKKGCLK